MTENSLDDLVKPDRKKEWEEIIKPRWFADDTPRGQKTPGYLKEEFTTDNGRYIGLRPGSISKFVKGTRESVYKVIIYFQKSGLDKKFTKISKFRYL